MRTTASPMARLRRAIEHGSLVQIREAARELPRIDIETSLRILLLIEEVEPRSYGPAATRWLGKLLVEHPSIELERAAELADALDAMGYSPEVSRAQISLALRSVGEERAADVLARS